LQNNKNCKNWTNVVSSDGTSQQISRLSSDGTSQQTSGLSRAELSDFWLELVMELQKSSFSSLTILKIKLFKPGQKRLFLVYFIPKILYTRHWKI
jgi:hypothetical protein